MGFSYPRAVIVTTSFEDHRPLLMRVRARAAEMGLSPSDVFGSEETDLLSLFIPPYGGKCQWPMSTKHSVGRVAIRDLVAELNAKHGACLQIAVVGIDGDIERPYLVDEDQDRQDAEDAC